MQTHTSIHKIFRIYRLSLSGLLAVIPLFKDAAQLFIDIDSTLLSAIGFSWFGVTLVGTLFNRKDESNQATIATNLIVDVIALTSLGWVAGGISSGLFFLLLPSVAIAGLLLSNQLALFIAAVASIGVLLVHTLLFINGQETLNTWFPAGVLGFMLFLCTLSFQAVRRRLSATERQAELSDARAAEYRILSEAVIAQMVSGLLVVDERGTITMINPTAEQMLAATNSISTPIVGSNLQSFPKLNDRYQHWFENTTLPVKSFIHEFSGVEIQPQFQFISGSTLRRTLITVEETRLIRQQALQAKVLALGKLSASLAHEVRNPLSAINQANDLLRTSEHLAQEDKQLVDIISRHCERMDQTISVTSQLSKQLEPDMGLIELKHWLEDFVVEYKEAQKDTCEIHINLKELSTIYFDSQHLRQILRNLVDNGMRYSKLACSKQDVAILSSYDRAKQLLFLDVHDRGLGVPKMNRDEIFSPFHSGSGGPGMGLYVCRELCQANFASINYLYKSEKQESGFFRITAWTKQPKQ